MAGISQSDLAHREAGLHTRKAKKQSAQKAAKDTKTDQELGFCHDPALPKEWARETRQKDAKCDDRCGLGGPCHIARPDIGRGRDALLRDPAWHVQKTCNGNI
jgi:hypothetical protein